MNPRSPFHHLLHLFQDRFFESDNTAPGSGFQTNIYQVLGCLLTSGFIVAYFMLPVMSAIMNRTKPCC